jgi:hypothetical protein
MGGSHMVVPLLDSPALENGHDQLRATHHRP